MKTVHIDLGSQGFEGEWLDALDPKYLTQRKWDEIAEASKANEESFIRELVVAWNLVNYDQPEQRLNDPKTDDLKLLSFGQIGAITAELQAIFNAALPKASAPPRSST